MAGAWGRRIPWLVAALVLVAARPRGPNVHRPDADCRASEGYTCMAPPFGGGMYCAPPMGMGGGDAGMPMP